MELGPLGTLYDQHQERSLSEAEVEMTIQQILNAVVYLEEKNVVHRDVKPANILVFDRDQERESIHTKLADFGLASQEQSLHTYGGTHVYAAPEIYTNKQELRRMDVWSLGVVGVEYTLGLPDRRWVVSDQLRWISALHNRLSEAPKRTESRANLYSTLSHMLCPDPQWRPSAQTCWDDLQLPPTVGWEGATCGRFWDQGRRRSARLLK